MKETAVLMVHARRTWYGLWALLFVALVACGLTVSNLGCLRGSSLTVLVGEEKLAGSYRPIRSDEYVAHGLMPAIQQFTAVMG